jgi:hypothetical protein
MWLLQELYLFNLTTMLQLIINKDEDKDVMIINTSNGSVIFNKEVSESEKDIQLYEDILKLLTDYLI